MFLKQYFIFCLLPVLLTISCHRSEQLENTDSPLQVEQTAAQTALPYTPPLELEWSEKLPTGWRAEQASIVSDVLYFTNFGLTKQGNSTASIIAAFDMNKRELLWHIDIESLIPIVVDSGHLVALTKNGIVAISTTNGSIVWQTAVPLEGIPYYDEILVKGGRVFYINNKSELYALNAKNGEILWIASLPPKDSLRTTADRPIRNYAMTYYNDTLYIRVVKDRINSRFMLVALNVQDGQNMWEFSFNILDMRGDSPPAAASRLAFSEKVIYFGGFGGGTYALQQSTGELLWKREYSIRRPVYTDDRIIADASYMTASGYYNGGIVALNSQTGDFEWIVPFEEYWGLLGSGASFALHNNYLIFYSRGSDESVDAQISVINIETGELVFTLHPTFPDSCTSMSSLVFSVQDEHLSLITLDCVHRFQIDWEN